ncbi:MAG: carbohydrate ABC transporter permease [Fimbriimonadaceae bacterium]|nr:carbohydrate ABC transporter permease [Fimbriimonadaceae bacterium]
MTSNLLFAIGTIGHFVGWVFLASAIFQIARTLSRSGDTGRTASLRSAFGSTIFALVGFGLGITLAGDGKALSVPLAWPDMHPLGWLFGLAMIGTVTFALQSISAITVAERKSKIVGALIFLAIAAFSLWWVMRGDNPFTLHRGHIDLSAGAFGSILTLLIATAALMGWVGRSAESSERVRGVSTQLTLFAGAALFMIPFAWLMVTSVKEDRDIAGTDGLNWVPKVSQTVPYFNDNNPLFEAQFRGRTVQAALERVVDAEQIELRVLKPMNQSGYIFKISKNEAKRIPNEAPVVSLDWDGVAATAFVQEDLPDGTRRVERLESGKPTGEVRTVPRAETEAVRTVGARWRNYPDALEFLPPEANMGLTYLKNTVILVVLSVIGTLLSCSLVAYGFSRLRFPGRETLFSILLATMMLPAAVTLLPQFLIFRSFGWIDSLLPLWVPTFFASAFNVFLLRSFFQQIPFELEDAAKIDGCGYLRTFWSVLMPQVKPALTVVAVWTFLGAWNNFLGPLIYVNSQENMPIAYALQLFMGERAGEPGLLMAFTALSIIPVLLLFAFSQRYFIEGMSLSGLGGR